MNNADKEYNNLWVKRSLAVTGRAVINQLVVKSLIYDVDPAAVATTASAPPLYSYSSAPAQASLPPPPTYLNVETTCVIPLSVAGTGNWLNLNECAFYSDLTPSELGAGPVQITDDQLNVVVVAPGIYKAECGIRIGSCGFGQHNFNIGLGIGNAQPVRPISACQAFGGTADLTGCANGTTLLKISEPNTIVQLYLRDDSPMATDANIFQGTLLFTPLLLF